MFAACQPEKQTRTPKQMKAAMDSLLKAKKLEIEQEAAVDLALRRSIEVKAKTDSILGKTDSIFSQDFQPLDSFSAPLVNEEP